MRQKPIARKAVAIAAGLALLISGTAGKCASTAPCVVDGQRVHGGGPRDGTIKCKQMQERARKAKEKKTPTSG